jgi:tripartite-type tricarboxylate transporter receptor subunit TctC
MGTEKGVLSVLAATAAAVMALFGPLPVSAQTAATPGDKITLAIGTPAGGGYDIYGRLVGRHLGRFLPGNPSILPTNMPGAGSLIEANWLYNIAPKDGTAIGIVPGATLYEALLGNKHAQFDARKFNWLASLNGYTPIAMVWHDTPFMSAQDLMTKQVIVGASGTSSDVTIWPNILNSLIGTKFKLVPGYPGTAGISLAMERGEVQGVVGDDWDSVRAGRSSWLRDHKVRILMQLRLARHPDLADVPTGLEFARDDETKGVLRLLIARHTFGRPFVAPPGVKPATVEMLRHAFDQMLADPEFRADAEHSHVTIDGAPGKSAQALVEEMYNSPPAIIARATRELRAVDP